MGLTIDRLEPGQPRIDTLHTAVPMTISGVGSFSACVEFLDRLRLNFRDTAAAAISLSSTSENDADAASPRAAFTFDLEWYAAPAASAAIPTDK